MHDLRAARHPNLTFWIQQKTKISGCDRIVGTHRRECFRVLRPGGVLPAGFLNPGIFIFGAAALDERGELVVRHRLAFSTLGLPGAERRRVCGEGPVE